ncbi:Crp/Fnr family transcriptional regulator [Anaerotignum lactatifermentans]|uniref:Crp/Fnr family transcriptional regulator n=1 Tax=Anaerotignum lactatifermentans TaxID=160404 RepID=A0ABS2G916_9FIRM|nr:Crp/Fnr family transcriptional regulator [Anaerotignum lactatifermentans]MBM6829026.1 Crp/Fnr family transcriptional regulator [Anaerotignum lactatifermentans]MBM6877367.1 Crp/Fnr family transcriptional regulator [Anaerotignum lactatifermentans]MBM6950737.1 Crp/Fnr family transcriptional regulator [Anaerotignum lactatifermentans]
MKLLDNPLFHGVSPEELDEMTHCFEMEERTFREKEEIPIHKNVGILLEGSVSINRLNADGSLDMLEYMSNGGIFGSFFSLFEEMGDLIVVCEKNCTVVFIDTCHITKRCSRACHHHSLVVENLLNLMTEKVHQLSEKVEILSHRSIRGKLLCYFQFQQNKTGTADFSLPFSFSALANYLCVDRSAMSRELKKMKNEGIIQMQGRKITLFS